MFSMTVGGPRSKALSYVCAKIYKYIIPTGENIGIYQYVEPNTKLKTRLGGSE